MKILSKRAKGLKPSPTLAINALISGAAGESLGLEPGLVLRTLFADAATVKPLEGFIRS